MKCPKCGTTMELVIKEGHGNGYECPKCHVKIGAKKEEEKDEQVQRTS